MIYKYGIKQFKDRRLLRRQVLFVVLAFLVMAALSYIFMSSIVRGGLVRSSAAVLDFAEERVSAELSDVRAVLESFAETCRGMVLRGDSAEALEVYIRDVSWNVSLIDAASADIKVFYGYFETLPGGPALLTGQRQSLSAAIRPAETDWYRLAAAAGGGVVETTPYIRAAGETLYTYAKSIRDAEGRQLGVVCIDVQTDEIGREVVNTALNQGGYGILLNQDLLILSHPNADFQGQYAYEEGIPLLRFADSLREGREVFEQPMISYKGEKSLVFFRRLSNGWYLGLVTPESQYYAGMSHMAVILFLLAIGLAAVLVAILVRMDMARAKSDDENQKKSMFLANMSHEIRTPINAIVGMTTIGRAAGTSERKDYCFSKIDSASKHLLGVVNDILDISKIEANKIELSATDFNFEKMLQQAVSVANFRADEKHQKLTVHIDKTIPRILHGDDQRLAQVITNLLSNAIKFTPEEGAISLKTKFLGEERGLCTVQVEVADTGIGISPEQQTRLFQPFSQAESSTTRKYGGTGLGLAISKSIVEMMSGKIRVESELGQGTKMIFSVKIRRGEDMRFDLSRHGVNWENVRILVVDDDPDVLLYFKEIITGFGAACDVAKDAKETLRLLEQNGAYDIYFVDLRMPDVDGISLTKEIRIREKAAAKSVVIMISSNDLSAVEHDAKKAGVNRFLLKPLFPSAIGDVISECIGVAGDQTAPAPADIRGLFAGQHILFAEDVDINREIVLTLLEPTGLGIDCAENGLEAVRLFGEAPEKYGMIFMDLQMPEMDGFEATRQIRALGMPQAAAVPIVAMTANVFREDIDACLAAGMNGHLGKPLDLDDMLEVLRRYLRAG